MKPSVWMCFMCWLLLHGAALAGDEAVVQVTAPRLYAGEKISVDFQNVGVRAALHILADASGQNIIASDSVTGNLTLRLRNLPWDQALDVLLQAKGLDMRRNGNVLWIAPREEMLAREKLELEQRAQIAELEPLQSAIFQLNYQKAEAFRSVFGLDAGEGRSRLLSRRGSVLIEPRTNQLFVTDVPARLEQIRQLIAKTDIATRQVMIEARIVEANVDYEKSLGVRWGGAVQLGGGLRAGGLAADGLPFVDLGVERATSGIGLGLVRDSVLLDLELSAMEKTGNGEIISQPKVVTADKETARILKGTEVPYQESGANGTTSTTFREASLSLEVTPQITADNRVIMTVKVTKDEPDYLNALNSVPPIRKNEVNAKVQVGDGETIVIGGVYATVQSNVVDKVPFFGDVPYVGRLFRRAVIQEKKSELLVFLTPRIMSDRAIAVSR